MKLLIDIGNTNTSLALFSDHKILKKYFIHTAKQNIGASALKRLLGTHIKNIDKVVIVSVVPKFLKLLKIELKSVLDKVPLHVVGKDIKVPVSVRYNNPEEVGQDRLVAAYTAGHKFGFPSLIVDFGTAVTFDFLNARGDYEGGLIFPGMRLGLESLINNAALLPSIQLKSVRGLIGKNTDDSMNKGIVLGYSALCDGIIEKFRGKYGSKIKIIATGGDSELIFKYTKTKPIQSKDLILFGLDILSP